jgi:hypothetical protein
MDESLRGPLIVAEVFILGIILAVVDDTVLRVVLGLLIGVLLARSALSGGEKVSTAGQERRQDHLFRHFVNVLLKKIREFHTVCQGISRGGVNMAVGQLRLKEIEREIIDLMSQVTDSATPSNMKSKGRARAASKSEKKSEAYGELADKE